MLHPKQGLPALGYWSHKIIRWCVPFLLLGALAANAALAAETGYGVFLAVQLLAYGAAVCDLIAKPNGWRFLRPVSYFFLMNLALFIGFFRFLRGTQRVTWERARS
jgi:hypothetical protein